MQKAVKRRVILVRFSEDEVDAMGESISKTGARSRSEFIREAVKHYLDTVGEMRVIRIKNVSKSQARAEILSYLKNKKEADTFDIANDLRLDLGLTMQSLKELWEGGRIE